MCTHEVGTWRPKTKEHDLDVIKSVFSYKNGYVI